MSTFRAVIIGTVAAVAGYFISAAIMSYLFRVPLLGQ